jgi:hypothetical protein
MQYATAQWNRLFVRGTVRDAKAGRSDRFLMNRGVEVAPAWIRAMPNRLNLPSTVAG